MDFPCDVLWQNPYTLKANDFKLMILNHYTREQKTQLREIYPSRSIFHHREFPILLNMLFLYVGPNRDIYLTHYYTKCIYLALLINLLSIPKDMERRLMGFTTY